MKLAAAWPASLAAATAAAKAKSAAKDAAKLGAARLARLARLASRRLARRGAAKGQRKGRCERGSVEGHGGGEISPNLLRAASPSRRRWWSACAYGRVPGRNRRAPTRAASAAATATGPSGSSSATATAWRVPATSSPRRHARVRRRLGRRSCFLGLDREARRDQGDHDSDGDSDDETTDSRARTGSDPNPDRAFSSTEPAAAVNLLRSSTLPRPTGRVLPTTHLWTVNSFNSNSIQFNSIHFLPVTYSFEVVLCFPCLILHAFLLRSFLPSFLPSFLHLEATTR